MHHRTDPPSPFRLLWLPLLLLALLTGCGEDGTVSTGELAPEPSGVFRAGLDPNGPGFEFRSNASGDPDEMIPGPFLIRGRNLRYDEAEGTLEVELTLVNRAETAFDEPVRLTLISLVPATVQVVGADNGATGAGASFDFAFADGDGSWSPDEESDPRTLRLLADPGVSVGLVARVDTGMLAGGGAIGGLVFHDLDRDGSMGMDEHGLGGVEIRLEDGFDLLQHVSTAPDGSYRFEGLPAGAYTVTRLPREDLEATTPVSIQVLLTESEGEVGDFLAANFGAVLHEPHDPLDFEVGDFVDATGRYEPDPPRLIAREISAEDDEHEKDAEDDSHEDEGEWGELRGPVTDLDLENDRVAVMGTWVHFDPAALAERAKDEDHPDESCSELTLDALELGDRVRARVALPLPEDEEAELEGVRLKCWNGNPDKIQGPIEEITRDEDDRIVELVILRTVVELGSHDH